MVIWITGLSGAGKTTICDAVRARLDNRLPHLVILDGDAIRDVFGNALGFKEKDRVVQINRLQRLAKMLSDQGLVVLVAALYSHPDLLAWNRANLNGYFEVYLDASIEDVRARDPKGLYGKAAAGQMLDVVGIDIDWRPPSSPDLVLDTSGREPVDVSVERLIRAVPILSQHVQEQ